VVLSCGTMRRRDEVDGLASGRGRLGMRELGWVLNRGPRVGRQRALWRARGGGCGGGAGCGGC
jgi:hypothetical protein